MGLSGEIQYSPIPQKVLPPAGCQTQFPILLTPVNRVGCRLHYLSMSVFEFGAVRTAAFQTSINRPHGLRVHSIGLIDSTAAAN